MNVVDSAPGAVPAPGKVHTLALDDEDYPPLLRLIPDPPPLLHVRQLQRLTHDVYNYSIY